jgi:hypothetical protein
MKSKILIPTLAIILSMLACNLPSNVPVTETPTVVLLPSNTPPPATQLPTQTPLSTDTPPPTTTSTPSVPTVFAKDVGVNCRFGPGIAWAPISALAAGQGSQIAGRNSDGSWWYIVDPFNSGRRCWVATSVTTTGGNLGSVPVVELPTASVTQVTVDVGPRTVRTTTCADVISPLRIEGTIETNGPTTVKWRFETQQGGPMLEQTTDFDAFGVKEFSAEYPLPSPRTPGTYWVRLIVSSPNAIQAEVSYRIECT